MKAKGRSKLGIFIFFNVALVRSAINLTIKSVLIRHFRDAFIVYVFVQPEISYNNFVFI